MRLLKFLFFFFLLPFTFLQAQIDHRLKGEVITEFGNTFSVKDPDFVTDTDRVYKVVFDIHNTPEDPSKLNPMINTLARFLNMHKAAGVPIQNMQVAGVFHNKATHDVLDDKGYREKYGVDNPNTALIQKLRETGAQLIVCGQSIHARGVERDKINPSVKVALSAITAILTLEQDGYRLIKF